MAYLRQLRQIVSKSGAADLVYVDESGFNAANYRPHAWAKAGHKTYGERSGARRLRTNLIAAKRGNQLLSPTLYEGSTTALWFNQWFSEYLLDELRPGSTIIMDNAAFHKKDQISAIAKRAGHTALFLPPYSPDFNPIEQDFAILKKLRTYAPLGTSIDQIIKEYGSFLE